MVDRDIYFGKIKQQLGGGLSRSASMWWNAADISGNLHAKSEALKGKTEALIFQNPNNTCITSRRSLRDLSFSINHFWWVEPEQKP